MATKDPGVVHPLDPAWLKTFLSTTSLNRESINCIIAALEKYNEAINAAGNTFEEDLKKCLPPKSKL
jgi:hypothetical protein